MNIAHQFNFFSLILGIFTRKPKNINNVYFKRFTNPNLDETEEYLLRLIGLLSKRLNFWERCENFANNARSFIT